MGLFIYQIQILPRMQLFVAHGKIYCSKTSSSDEVQYSGMVSKVVLGSTLKYSDVQ